MPKLTLSLTCMVSGLALPLAAEDRAGIKYSTMEDRIQLAFVMQGFMYSAEREGNVDDKTKTAWVKIQLYKIPMGDKASAAESARYELKDGWLLLDAASFLRWRLTSTNQLWGTECTLDNGCSGVFKLPLRILKRVETDKRKAEEDTGEWRRYGTNMKNFIGGDPIIQACAGKYRLEKQGWGGSAAEGGGMHLDRLFRGMDGIYFDFVPKKDENWITLFVLFNKDRMKFSSGPKRSASKNAIDYGTAIKVWLTANLRMEHMMALER